MKLIIKAHGMVIRTESVQDVAYLKQLGYYSENPNIHMKATVTKITNGYAEDGDDDHNERVRIELGWEDKNNGHEDGDDPHPDSRECVQHIEGPRLKFMKCTKDVKS